MWAQPELKVEVAALGRPLAAVSIVQRRDLGLSIAPSVGGYDCTVWGAVMGRARLPILPADLAKAVDVARDELLKVVMWRDPAGKYAFQTRRHSRSRSRLRAHDVGARRRRLVQKVVLESVGGGGRQQGRRVFATNGDRDAKAWKLQFLADSAPIPWGMLYMGDASAGAKLDWRYFLGMSHVIEMIPLQNTLTVSASEIPTDRPKLAVSVNVNRGIDGQMGLDLVAQQESYWGGTHELAMSKSSPARPRPNW